MADRPLPNDASNPPPGLTWRDPVLWLVVGPPLAAVLGGLATVWIAATHRDPMVTGTVQKVGVTWQEPAPAAPATTPSTRPPAPATTSDDDGG